MATEPSSVSELELGHVLFMDIVGYSMLLVDEQSDLARQLNQIVRNTEQVHIAEAKGKLVRLPTGDGMALVFFTSPEAPMQCALEVSRALKDNPALKLRMGLHSGPVNAVSDINERENVAGIGINIAQRVMDCGDAGHILLSERVAEDLAQYARWRDHLHELGQVEVKHGVKLDLVNYYNNEVGNSAIPEKFRQATREEKGKAGRLASARRRKRVFVGAALLLAIAAGLVFWIFFRQSSLKTATGSVSEKSIAVLPLENLTEEKENAYFADGIQDELLSNLAKIKDLKVISRTSVMQYKAGITRNLKEIAKQLGVSNVVEGSVRRSGNHVRVSVQLIDAMNDRHIWVQNYDRTLADSLALQGELATEIAAGVGATLSPQEKARVEATPTQNIAAYDAYLRGRVFSSGVSWERSNVEGAIRSFQEAVKLDPNFVLAWTHLSHKQCDMYWLGFDPTSGRLAAAKDALDHALALDPNLPETHLALGYYRYYAQRDFNGALAEFQLAEKSLPNSVDVLRAISLMQRRLARWDEAIMNFRCAVELDPRNIDLSVGLATTCFAVRRFSEVITVADRILMLDPTNRGALFYKVAAYWAMGDPSAAEPLLANPGAAPEARGVQALLQRRYAAAIEILSKALSDAPDEDRPSLLLGLGLSKQRAGDVAGARATYQQAVQYLHRQLENVAPDSFQEAGLRASLGVAYAGLGEAASAIAEGERAMAMDPASKDPFEGPEKEQAVATIYALLGDADHAIPILKRLLQTAYGSGFGSAITPGLLRIDPVWDPIRNDPRFQELAAETKR
jgi:TolB-like protein/cytochrome c-type biogenesis protein CcmH/NrfG